MKNLIKEHKQTESTCLFGSSTNSNEFLLRYKERLLFCCRKSEFYLLQQKHPEKIPVLF